MGKPISQITCGSEYSAAVTITGDLYMWGRGNYGRLGTGSSDDVKIPTQVSVSLANILIVCSIMSNPLRN